jgi:hypothetical protein
MNDEICDKMSEYIHRQDRKEKSYDPKSDEMCDRMCEYIDKFNPSNNKLKEWQIRNCKLLCKGDKAEPIPQELKDLMVTKQPVNKNLFGDIH